MQISVEDIIKIQPKGLITIPKKLRDDVGLVENGLARIKRDGRRLILEPVSIIGVPLRTYSKKQIREFIKQDRISPALKKQIDKL